MRLEACLVDGLCLSGDHEPTWVALLGFCSLWKCQAFHLCSEPAKNLTAGPYGPCHLCVGLVPEDGLGKGKPEATHPVF